MWTQEKKIMKLSVDRNHLKDNSGKRSPVISETLQNNNNNNNNNINHYHYLHLEPSHGKDAENGQKKC